MQDKIQKIENSKTFPNILHVDTEADALKCSCAKKEEIWLSPMTKSPKIQLFCIS